MMTYGALAIGLAIIVLVWRIIEEIAAAFRDWRGR